MTEESDFETVVGLLDDEHARTILRATSTEPRSAAELASRCEASRQTMYRKLEELTAAGLVTEQTRPRKDGHHDTVYTATLDKMTVSLEDGEFRFDVDREQGDAIDELTRLWREF